MLYYTKSTHKWTHVFQGSTVPFHTDRDFQWQTKHKPMIRSATTKKKGVAYKIKGNRISEKMKCLPMENWVLNAEISPWQKFINTYTAQYSSPETQLTIITFFRYSGPIPFNNLKVKVRTVQRITNQCKKQCC